MKVLVIGEGAREHAIAESLANAGDSVFALASFRNPGLLSVTSRTGGRLLLGRVTDPSTARRALQSISPDLVVIGPEDPLFSGVSETVREEGIPVVGPNSSMARIEASKVWMRQLMEKYDIPGRLRFKSFDSIAEAAVFVKSVEGSIVIKPAEQVGGKGVRVITDIQAYLSQDKKESASFTLSEISTTVKGKEKVIVEEKVEGPEYTLHGLSDGHSMIFLPLAQDYKHAFDYGVGPETGGMGSISGPKDSLPFITSSELEETKDILNATIKAVEAETKGSYVGFLGGQMMLTPLWGPTVIEYYTRLGDPEASSIITRVRNFGELLHRVGSTSLARATVDVMDEPAVVKVVAPRGYPMNRNMAAGHSLTVDVERIREAGCIIYFGSVSLEGGKLVTQGSRALELVALGGSKRPLRG